MSLHFKYVDVCKIMSGLHFSHFSRPLVTSGQRDGCGGAATESAAVPRGPRPPRHRQQRGRGGGGARQQHARRRHRRQELPLQPLRQVGALILDPTILGLSYKTICWQMSQQMFLSKVPEMADKIIDCKNCPHFWRKPIKSINCGGGKVYLWFHLPNM